MHDGHYIDGALASAMEEITPPLPLSKLVVLIPVIEGEDNANPKPDEVAVFHWSILEGENSTFSRHPSPKVRAKFACALALRAYDRLESILDEAAADGQHIDIHPRY